MEQGIKLGPEPNDRLVPAVPLRVGLLHGRLNGVVPSRLPRWLSSPLGTGRGRDGWRKGNPRWGGTLRNRVSE